METNESRLDWSRSTTPTARAGQDLGTFIIAATMLTNVVCVTLVPFAS